MGAQALRSHIQHVEGAFSTLCRNICRCEGQLSAWQTRACGECPPQVEACESWTNTQTPRSLRCRFASTGQPSQQCIVYPLQPVSLTGWGSTTRSRMTWVMCTAPPTRAVKLVCRVASVTQVRVNVVCASVSPCDVQPRTHLVQDHCNRIREHSHHSLSTAHARVAACAQDTLAVLVHTQLDCLRRSGIHCTCLCTHVCTYVRMHTHAVCEMWAHVCLYHVAGRKFTTLHITSQRQLHQRSTLADTVGA